MLGENIMAHRRQLGISQQTLAEQLAVQNRRRRRIWTVLAWVLGLIVALHALLLVLGWAASVDVGTMTETTVMQTQQTDNAGD